MSRQDKTISERHTRTLRELVKSPENKVCADCKRNDPRWASWNIGVFLCIRCSGIHRSMGTHISKVKSVDLDIWTPDQMDSIQRWGNARANLYWEAHLKPGHIPAEHKMESFIRSKYESRRWALEGPPPKDPSILENHSSEPPPPPPIQSQAPSPPVAALPQSTKRQSRTLVSAQISSKLPPSQTQQAVAPAAPSSPVASSQDDIFSLDFRAPAATSSTSGMTNEQKKDVKNDILSLFSSPPSGSGVIGGGGANFGVAPPQVQAPCPPTSMMGTTGTAMWGVQSGWNGMQTAQPKQPNIWGQPQPQSPFQQQQQFNASGGAAQPQNPKNIWGGDGSAASGGGALGDLFSAPFSSPATQPANRKDDAFGDLWGGFK